MIQSNVAKMKGLSRHTKKRKIYSNLGTWGRKRHLSLLEVVENDIQCKKTKQKLLYIILFIRYFHTFYTFATNINTRDAQRFCQMAGETHYINGTLKMCTT